MQEDAILVAKAIKNPNAYSEIVAKYEKPLLRYVLRISNVSREEAEDILQEVFLKAYQNLNDYDSSLKFSSWIYRITHNEVISKWRKRKARVEEVGIDEADAAHFFQSTFDIESEMDSKILAKEVNRILAKLPEKYREVLILRFIEDKDYETIGDILRKPAGSVATLIARGKKQLQEEIQKANLSKFLIHE